MRIAGSKLDARFTVEPLEGRIAPAFSGVFNLADINGNNGFKAIGDDSSDSIGSAVAGAGDVNGDGFDDVIVAADYTSFVLFGKAGGFTSGFDLTTLDGTNGFVITGIESESNVSVDGAGDLNNDGFDDLIIGDRFAGDVGAGYVIFGKATGFAAEVDVTTLDGVNGFTINGATVFGDRLGSSVSGAGDLNGDGFDDVIIGAPNVSANGNYSGASFVIFGKANGFAADLDVSALNGTNGFRIAGAADSDRLGYSVSGAGDLNGDGFDDVIVGAPGADLNSGAAYVVFGKGVATPFAASLTVSALDGSNGFKLAGNFGTGRDVSGLGDINGDGFTDIGVSGQNYAVSVVFGKAGGFAPSISLGSLSSPDGFQVVAPSKGGSVNSVRPAGDVNKDGIDDFIVNRSVIFGRTAGFGDLLDVRTQDGATGFTLESPRPFDVVTGAGDFNKDGFADLVIGAPLNTSSGSAFVVFGQAAGNPSLSVGDAAVVEGDTGSAVLEFTVTLSSPSAQTVTVVYNSLNGSAMAGSDYTAAVNQSLTFAPGETTQTITIQVSGDVLTESNEGLNIVLSNPVNAQLKRSVAVGTIENDDAPSFVNSSTLNGANGFFIDGAPYGATDVGDVNGDGFGDIAVSGYNAYYGTNALYVVFGKAGGFGTNLDLGTIDGTNGFIVALDSYDGHAITSVEAAGDINGDGFDDLLIGDQFYGYADYDSLRTYVVFGKETPFGPSVDVGALDGTNGFTLVGQRQLQGFLNSAEAGDVNGDGFDDIILVDYLGRSNGATTGVAYVVFGKATGFLPEVDMEALTGANGFKVIGDYNLSGAASIGDINGDGFGDVAVSSNYGYYGYGVTTQSYVIYGSANPFAPELSVTALNGNNGFTIDSLATGVGDINGDGFDDLGVSRSVYVDEYNTETHNYVLFGKASSFGVQTSVTGIDGSNGFEVLNGGFPVAAGDVNGDGFDDLISGTSVIFGKGSSFGPTIDAQALNGRDGFKVLVSSAEYHYGHIAAVGDVNGDGFDDLTGSSYDSYSYTNVGFVIFGKPTGGATLKIDNASVAEGNSGTTALSFHVTLSQAATSPVTVFYSTTDGSALAGPDFTGVSNQQLTFAPGETSKTIVIDVLGDTFVESAETFSVVLSNPTNAALDTATGVGTITNDDSIPVGVTVSIGDASLAEGDSGQTAFVFPLTLSEASAQDVTVLVSTSNGTATSGGDFAALLNQSVTFAAGETTKTVTVQVSGDTSVETNETFSVLLSAPTNASIGRGTGLGTILNDDIPVPIQLSIADAAVVEGNSGTSVLNFVVSLNTASSQAVTVLASTVNGTASDASDYTGITNSLIEFAPGETSKTFSVLVSGDATVELNENLTVVLASPTNASISRGAATGSIVNDDVTIPDPQMLTFVEPDGDEITVELSGGTLDFGDLVFEGTPDGPVLAKIDLTGQAAALDGGTLTISVKSQGGDGNASIGLIDATGVNLKKVTIEGDVTSLIIGSSSSSLNAGKAPKAELAELFVQSFGQNASKFPSLTPSLKVPGGVGKFTVGGDFANIEAALGGGNGAGVKQLVVGGSIIGSKFDVPGGIKSMKVKNMVDSTFNVGRQLQNLAVSGSITDTTVSVNGPLKKMTVAGSITDSSIYAPGTTGAKNQKQSVALGSLSVGGSFVRSELLGGFDTHGAPVNPDASLGKISISGGFDSSVIAAGVKAGDDGFFGTDDDRLISASDNKVIAAIAAIQINGLVTGSVSETDSFGIVAEEVKSVKLGKSNVSLRGGAANDLTSILLNGTTDVVVREVGV